MEEIRLSQINDENLTDEQIDSIVYSDIEDDELSSEYGLVFGNSMLIKERVNTSVDTYKKGRVKKLIFMGGVNGVSNQDNSTIPEAIKMKELAISLGVNENDILIDDTSNNTFENIENAMKLLPSDTDHISIITSEFHLKRCYAILKKLSNISVTMIPSKDLCFPKVQNDWNENNKCFGMCAITSLVVNDYFGGDICKIYVDGISHYFNLIEDKIIDLTSSQFNHEIDYKNYQTMDRQKILTDDTKNRYITLKARLINKLLKQIDEKVYSCKSCDKLVDKFPNDATVFLGKDNDIVLVGEAPANNGWRKSHKLWCDINGKILPSGVVLQKLFDIINRNIFETTFLESVKCYPLMRKNLKTCSNNCKNIMLEQLKILNPKLIITLGEFPTRNLLDFKFDKFSDVVGKIYEVNGYKVLPIYHPSPISPKSYTGNIPIFESLQDIDI